MIAMEMPAAMGPYSIAVAPFSSFKNLMTRLLNLPALPKVRGWRFLPLLRACVRTCRGTFTIMSGAVRAAELRTRHDRKHCNGGARPHTTPPCVPYTASNNRSLP